jgi:hypothetical protein
MLGLSGLTPQRLDCKLVPLELAGPLISGPLEWTYSQLRLATSKANSTEEHELCMHMLWQSCQENDFVSLHKPSRKCRTWKAPPWTDICIMTTPVPCSLCIVENSRIHKVTCEAGSSDRKGVRGNMQGIFTSLYLCKYSFSGST